MVMPGIVSLFLLHGRGEIKGGRVKGETKKGNKGSGGHLFVNIWLVSIW